MDLKTFVSATLTQIIEGVLNAQSELSIQGASVNPGPTGGGWQVVEFDVAISATEGTETKAGIGVVSALLNAGASGKSNQEASAFSRVKFSVPVKLPAFGDRGGR